ncbi:MAG: DUF599 family protein [Gammaproteobacteria bacterium]|uniref:DUF599 domain-containing protein n=1 Tax=Pseudomaricurvus alcaniphilus TaxID=1166482 RepID=UPI001408A598|nr:DUF599 domain-containing protein [Pseudomaricurvus alcaniphilus]MBR9912166.1 DUF599 family protein [Gammaproteobacteria bacterium]NHN35694.1 DUF599 family protein [Pseudomaricurvus alcaniphilus]
MENNFAVLNQYVGYVNFACLVWLLSCWIGYARFAKIRAKQIDCIASIMHKLRMAWMREALFRDVRVSDTSIIANLERNVSFMASTSIFMLAGLVTALTSTDVIYSVLADMHLASATSPEELQFKILVLICIFVYAFFTFTWSLRQFGFCSVIIGASPTLQPDSYPAEVFDRYARHSGKVLDQAAHTNNYGLRAYYYAMATLAWFVHPLLFVFAVALVVLVLYQREFKSKTLQSMLLAQQEWSKGSQTQVTPE